VAKAISAFANSGGGSLILGVKDDGIPDGLPPLVGRATIRDWIEQKIPHLLDYPLADFRVHTVIKSDPSHIPDNRQVIVVDVGDSATAPHQSKRDKIYYRREGGRSERAPHFYLELLRQRLTNPVLEFVLTKVEPFDVCEHDDGLFLIVQLNFTITNVGRVAAYHWRLNIRSRDWTNDNFDAARWRSDYRFSDFPCRRQGLSTITINEPILPGCWLIVSEKFGCQLRPNAHTAGAVRAEIEAMLTPIAFSIQLATENSPGELRSILLSPVLDVDALVTSAWQKCMGFFHI
jgi:hypothetical protein